jgi:DNA-binding GntR family transcriptional regulator
MLTFASFGADGQSGEGEAGAKGRAGDIYRSIFEAIIDQRLPPGAKLAEEQLGALFEASRTLVRSALQALAHDHIVTIERNRGAFVAAPSVAEADDIFFSRRVVESGIALEVAGLVEPAHIASLERLLAEEAEALHSGDRQRAIRLSGAFHMAIARVRGEGALTRFLASLISRSSLVIALYGRGPNSACGHAEHGGVVEALKARDGRRAATMMIEHLDHIYADLALRERTDKPVELAAVLERARRRS